MRRIRRHLTYSNVMVTILAFIVLSGGTAVALNGTNTVFTDDVADDTRPASGGNPAGGLVAADLRPSAVGTSEVTNGSLTGSDISEANLDATPLRTRVAQGGCSPSVAGTGVMVKVGPVCIDKYEVSVWSSPTGGTQYGASSDNYPCNDNGQNCDNIYARSVAGVTPSRFITYFQAQQALANSDKRLPTNAEWQTAVAGTPDGSPCNVNSAGAVNTGSAPSCVSRFGAFDMVGNLLEWVGDWDEQSTGACGNWPAGFGSDVTCMGRGGGEFPAALMRGGSFQFPGDTGAGPFAVDASDQPSNSDDDIGFRGAR